MPFIEALPAGVRDSGGGAGHVVCRAGSGSASSIARALLREPSLLILDEATSQIDAESEEQINLAIAEFPLREEPWW